MRVIVGKKLSSRTRRDLDDIANQRSGCSLHSVQRQFDNLRRVFKTVEDVDGRTRDVIAEAFLLDEHLAEVYARMVFICKNHLLLTKRNLAGIHFREFLYCAGLFMKHWTPPRAVSDASDQDFDRHFLQRLRELTFRVSGGHDAGLQQLCTKIAAAFPPFRRRLATDLVRGLIKGLLHIGAGLSNSRELRDIFEDLVAKVVGPCREKGWGEADVCCAGALACEPCLVLC